MASWEAIFRNTVQIRFDLSDAKVHVKGDLAWVLTENIATPLGDERTITPIIAVNLFEKVGGRWRMVHHHASHILADPQRFY
jgi:ketosteroid isomerase-like protein